MSTHSHGCCCSILIWAHNYSITAPTWEYPIFHCWQTVTLLNFNLEHPNYAQSGVYLISWITLTHHTAIRDHTLDDYWHPTYVCLARVQTHSQHWLPPPRGSISTMSLGPRWRCPRRYKAGGAGDGLNNHGWWLLNSLCCCCDTMRGGGRRGDGCYAGLCLKGRHGEGLLQMGVQDGDCGQPYHRAVPQFYPVNCGVVCMKLRSAQGCVVSHHPGASWAYLSPPRWNCWAWG